MFDIFISILIPEKRDSIADDFQIFRIMCPWCGIINTKLLEDEIEPLITTFVCECCRRRMLVGGTNEKPYAVNPMMLIDREVCYHGCHFGDQWGPEGFIPVANCPIHWK